MDPAEDIIHLALASLVELRKEVRLKYFFKIRQAVFGPETRKPHGRGPAKKPLLKDENALAAPGFQSRNLPDGGRRFVCKPASMRSTKLGE